jgi:hypothetical protein
MPSISLRSTVFHRKLLYEKLRRPDCAGVKEILPLNESSLHLIPLIEKQHIKKWHTVNHIYVQMLKM